MFVYILEHMEWPQVSILATRSLVESSYFSLQMPHSGCSPREEPLLRLLLSISNDREAMLVSFVLLVGGTCNGSSYHQDFLSMQK